MPDRICPQFRFTSKPPECGQVAREVRAVGRCRPRKIAMGLRKKQRSAPAVMPMWVGECSAAPPTSAPAARGRQRKDRLGVRRAFRSRGQHPQKAQPLTGPTWGKRFLRAGYGEKGKRSRIEQEHRAAVCIELRIPQKHHACGQEVYAHIALIVDGRGDRTNEDITRDTACAPGREGKNHQSEEVQLVLYACCCT